MICTVPVQCDSFPVCKQYASVVLLTPPGQNEGTLLMKENEVLYIIEEDKGDGWTRARKQSGEEGYVPTSYVEIAMEKNSKGAVTYI